ncbi:DUF721 domain-containing protein [Sodalis endosymbiont of Henestaris halophilus]|uniref:DUF721 domain-containing protein n=1 Tax=Sodalis endosymbiont of Henestaris halophilus TaxID=1929246 RepID=UPI000BBF55A1|nr:DciA family protein [Sodalis endosymbiont of Henestaris halophilus]SNC58993.1 hypothetical protein HBA_0765 [Sodalis endosymbiont of Henestaris halophilus]
MRYSHPYPIDSLFDASTERRLVSLSQIKQQAIMLLKLNRMVNALLPAPMRPSCRVANFRHGMLVLETANASWQMRLRYEQPQLLSKLRTQILPSLSCIDIRINPNLAKTQALTAQKNDNDWQLYRQLCGENTWHLSLQSAAFIRHVSASSEGKLKNALERLADLAGKSTDYVHRKK